MAIKRITTNLIKDSDIATVDIANNAITAAKITDGNITTAKLADLSVTAGKLAGTLDLTGKTITVATATTGDNDTSPASTAFVQQEIAALVDSSPSSLNTLNELAAALGDDASFSTTVTNSIATKAPLASPTLTGTVTVDTDANSKFTIADGGTDAITLYGGSGDELYIGANAAYKLRFKTDGNIVMDNGGSFGIGTSSPLERLHIQDYTGIAINSNYCHVGSTVSGAMAIFGHNIKSDSANNTIKSANTGYHSSMIKMYYNEGITFHATSGTATAGDTFYDIGATTNELMRITNSGNLLVNQTSAGTNGKLQVTGGIGLTGDSVIRQSTNSDGSTLRFLGTQFVAGSSNAVGYSYSSGALIASVSNSANVTLFEAGASNTSGHRLTIQNDATGLQGEVKYAGSEPVFILRDTRNAGGTAWSSTADEHLGEIQFWTSDATGVGPHSVARIKTVNDITAASPAGRLSFFTSQYNDSSGGWEKMRIASNGPISMYSASNNTLQLNTSSSASGTNNLIRAFSDSNISSGGTVRFVVFPSGNVQNSNNSYGQISDETKKENIVDATNKLDALNQVRVRNFNFIGDDLKQIGVVAQELETIFPSMVEDIQDQDAEGNVLETSTKSVKYSVFVPILIKAIQELKTELDAAKARLDEAGL